MSQAVKLILDNATEQSLHDTRGLPTLDIYESHVLNGTAWGVSNVSSSTAGSVYYHIRTPNTTTSHKAFLDISTEHATSGGSTIALYNTAPTITTTGTVLTPLNRSFGDTANTTTMQVFYGTAYDSSLTSTNLVETHAVNADYPDVKMGRFLLGSNANYTLKYTGVASNTTAHININWYVD